MIQDTNSQDPKQEGAMYTQTRVKLEKNLASPNKAIRAKAMSVLCLWLTSQKEIKEEELTKIWKGLFYCLLHAEKKVATHVELVDRMAHLMEKLDVELSLVFFKVFLTSLRTEWGGIDNNSLGRFHFLLKEYVSQMFAVLKRSEWDMEVVRKFMDALAERALLVQDGINSNGINVSIADVFLNELRHYLPIPAGVFKVLLEPFWVALSKGCDDMVAEEISKKVFLVLFDHGSRLLLCDQGFHGGDTEKKACFGHVALNLALAIRSKSSALLAFASHSKSVQLRLIEEKFSCLEKLAQSHVSTSEDNVNMSNDQTETQSTNCSAESADRLQKSVSPAQVPVTRTFGRRSKRNQKLVFSPQTVNDIYMKKTVEKRGNLPEDIPVQIMREETSTEQGNEVGIGGGNASLDKTLMGMVASETEHNSQTGDIIDVDGSPPNQDTVISDEADNDNILAAGDDGRDEADNDNILAASDDGITMEDPVISNLAKRFESIADPSPSCEVDESSVISTPLAPSSINTGSRKRKTWKMLPANVLDSESPTSAKENNVVPHDPFQEDDVTSIDNVSAKKAKKVHFSLQHNIVWLPSTPLPPHNVRVPPAATPRGSALKKGVPPGPIVELSVHITSPKKKKSTPRKAPSAHSRSPKSAKNSAKVRNPSKRGRLSPR